MVEIGFDYKDWRNLGELAWRIKKELGVGFIELIETPDPNRAEIRWRFRVSGIAAQASQTIDILWLQEHYCDIDRIAKRMAEDMNHAARSL